MNAKHKYGKQIHAAVGGTIKREGCAGITFQFDTEEEARNALHILNYADKIIPAASKWHYFYAERRGTEVLVRNLEFDLRDFIRSGAEILRLSNVDKLIGKTILWSHPVYEENRPTLHESKVCAVGLNNGRVEVTTEENRYDYEAEPGEPFRRRVIFLSNDNQDEPFFACSDSDRPVYFIEK